MALGDASADVSPLLKQSYTKKKIEGDYYMAKPSIMALLAKPAGGEEGAEEDSGGEDHSLGAAEELIAAVNGGNAAKVLKAFNALFDLHGAKEADEELGEDPADEAAE